MRHDPNPDQVSYMFINLCFNIIHTNVLGIQIMKHEIRNNITIKVPKISIHVLLWNKSISSVIKHASNKVSCGFNRPLGFMIHWCMWKDSKTGNVPFSCVTNPFEYLMCTDLQVTKLHVGTNESLLVSYQLRFFPPMCLWDRNI